MIIFEIILKDNILACYLILKPRTGDLFHVKIEQKIIKAWLFFSYERELNFVLEIDSLSQDCFTFNIKTVLQFHFSKISRHFNVL